MNEVPEVPFESPEENHAEPEASPGSFLSNVRKRREELRHERHLDVEVPGYQGLLLVRLRPVPAELVQRLTERSQKQKWNERADLEAAADLLINACEMLLKREGGVIEPWLVDGETVRFDKELAKAFEFPNAEDMTARQVLLEVFPDDLSVIVQSGEFLQWQSSGDTTSDDQLYSELKSDPTLRA